MGNYSDINILWIDPDVYKPVNITFLSKLPLVTKSFEKINKSIEYLKKIRFQETKIIISGKLYSEFIKNFKENILYMHIAPKIKVFTRSKDKFIENNDDYKDSDNKFYVYGGVTDQRDGVLEFINNGSIQINKNEIQDINQNNNEFQEVKKINNEIQFTFEYINCKEKLMIPLFFKSLLNEVSNNDIQNYTQFLYTKYSKTTNNIQKLLGSILSIPDIPIEILSKYYARLYTDASPFHSDLNKDLGTNKIDKYIIIFIKILYEGVKLKSFPLAFDKELYRGSLIFFKEIDALKNNFKNKIEGLPSSIVFSRAFMSFSKEEKIAKRFLKDVNIKKNLCKVLYILEKGDKFGYDLSTHADIENISFFAHEKEVLFFPFSAFEVKNVIEKNFGEEKIYEIRLLYLGKYLEDIKNDKNLILKENKIPDSEYKTQLIESGLFKKEKLEKINTKVLFNSYKQLKTEINNSYIIGEIFIDKNHINKDIQIINSFENTCHGEYFFDEPKFKNEDEIKSKIEIRINGKKIDFTYVYKFEKEGKYIIEYLFENCLTKTNHLFYGCNALKSLNLSKFNTKNVTYMCYMFYKCNSLENLDLSNINTEKVTDMKYMFAGCNSLIKLNLSDFNTKNVTDMWHMFSECKSIIYLNLSNFNTQNVIDMKYMFSECKSLKYLNLKTFNTLKVTDMKYMFSECNSLIKLNLSNFNTQYVNDMRKMFYGCTSLKKENVLTQDNRIKQLF